MRRSVARWNAAFMRQNGVPEEICPAPVDHLSPLSPPFHLSAGETPLSLAGMNNTPNGFVREDPWRIFRIMAEFVDSFETLSAAGPAVTIFGSARTSPSNHYYKTAVALAEGLAKNNLAVITGG